MDDTPVIGPKSAEELAAIRAEFGHIATEIGEDPSLLISPAPAPKRRGRPPGSKNKSREPDSFDDAGRLPILPAAPMSNRDAKQVADRLQGILEGATGVLGVAKPYLAMKEDEAKAISEPLASYLIRTEPTSGVAKQILEEYDIAAFTIATLAYGVRVYQDRGEELKENAKRKSEPKPVQPATQSQSRTVGGPLGPIVEQPATNFEDANGQNGNVDKKLASTIQVSRSPSEL